MQMPDSLNVPAKVVEIVDRLEEAGYETWCVGGAVRDSLIGAGLTSKDFDLATAATPDVVQKLFRRTVPVGIRHGTVGVVDTDNEVHELTTFRRDVKTDGRHAVVEFGVELHEDLARRDFTINAIAYHPTRSEFRDPFDGAADLEKGVVRAVGDAAQRFREDYLRILRGIRFASRYGFEIEVATWAASISEGEGLGGLSAERVREEWFDGLARARDRPAFVRMWEEVGALDIWLPEVEVTREAALSAESLTPEMLTAFLSNRPRSTFERLKCSNAQLTIADIVDRFREHELNSDDDVAVRRFMMDAGRFVDLAVQWLDGRDGNRRVGAAVESVRARGEATALSELAVTGEDLIEAGVTRGPLVGETLKWLLATVVEEPEKNDRQSLLQLVASRRQT